MPAGVPFLHQPRSLAVIFGSYLLVNVALVAWGAPFRSRPNGLADLMSSWPTIGFVWLFGVTHFFLTFTVFFDVRNRAHFRSDSARWSRFVLVPLGLFVALWAFYGLGLDGRFAMFGIGVLVAIRAFDFYHLNRQSFGVLQMMKGRSGSAFPAWVRTVENAWFLGWVAMLLSTFLSRGMRFDPGSLLNRLLIAGLIVGAVALTVGYTQAARAGANRRELGLALGYLSIQTLSVVPAVWWTGLYAFALAVHYAEYHLLMGPRWGGAELDAGSAADRAFEVVRARPWLLYGILLVLSAAYLELRTLAQQPTTVAPRFLIHCFDGLFVFHYVIEMFLWKFSDPYWRSRLAPLYFAAAR